MRAALEQRSQERLTITATVKRYGGKHTVIDKMGIDAWEETILLVDVKDANTGDELTDHTWMKVGKRFLDLNAKTGDTIQLDARIDRYVKKDGIDYHFERPTKLKIVASNPEQFPEETARMVGTGIEYAKKLAEFHQISRMASLECFDDD